MAVQASGTKTEQLMAKRDAYVARGVALAPIVADHGHGARLTDVDGKEYIDFAGGIGVLNLGHTPDAVVDAIKHQADKMLHSCFPVASCSTSAHSGHRRNNGPLRCNEVFK